MPTVLFNIPLVRWVQRTIERMNAAGKDDFETWSNYWFQTYRELGGTSDNQVQRNVLSTLHMVSGVWVAFPIVARLFKTGRLKE